MSFVFILTLNAKPIKIATYNVENLFDAYVQGSEYKEYVPNKHNWTHRMVETKLQHIAQVICDLNADILGLQEIENEEILIQLQNLLRQVGCPYRYRAITHKKGAPIQVALLSRYPIQKRREITVSTAPKVRNILETTLNIKGHPLLIYVNHWKSKSYRGYESKRIAYAKALKKRLMSLPAGKDYILVGDFNSDYNADDTLSAKNNDTQGRTGFNTILPTRKAGKLISEKDLLDGNRLLLYSLWLELPVERRWSQNFYGKHSSPDQIVIPSSLVDGKGIDYINDSFGVFRRRYLFTRKGYINRWQYKHNKHNAKGFSDHLPVYAWFDLKPYKPSSSNDISATRSVQNIERLYTLDQLNNPVILRDAVVVLKRGNHAVIKQSPSGRGIFIYGGASQLKEGFLYDFEVEGLKRYKGLVELLSVHIVKEKGKMNIGKFRWRSLSHKLRQNEIIQEIEGVYRDGYLYIGDQKISIYFKKRSIIPKEGSRLKIYNAHLGYYNRLQLVVYNKKDFTIKEEGK